MIGPEIFTAAAEEIAALRAHLFRESPMAILERVAIGLIWALQPARAASVRSTLAVGARSGGAGQGPARPRKDTRSRLAGIVHDLSRPTLIEAYQRPLHLGPFRHTGLDLAAGTLRALLRQTPARAVRS